MEFKPVMRLKHLRQEIRSEKAQQLFRLIDGLPIDYCDQDFLNYLAAHRIIGVLGSLNPDFAQQAKTQRQNVLCESLKKFAALVEIKQQFKEAGIRFFVLKGLVLSQLLYGDFSIRQSCDIDILIEPVNSFKADQIFRKLGYTNRANYIIREKDIPIIQKRAHDIGYVNAEKGVCFECHFRVKENEYLFNVPFEALWERRQTIRIQKHDFDFFGLEDLLIYLSMHGAHHHYARLHWLMDVSMLIQTYTFDFDRLLKQAKNLNCERVFCVSILLACEMLDRPVPMPVKSAFEKDKVAVSIKNWCLLAISARQKPLRKLLAPHLQMQLLAKPAYKWACLKNRFIGRHNAYLKFGLPKCVFYLTPIIEPFIQVGRLSVFAFKKMTQGGR